MSLIASNHCENYSEISIENYSEIIVRIIVRNLVRIKNLLLVITVGLCVVAPRIDRHGLASFD